MWFVLHARETRSRRRRAEPVDPRCLTRLSRGYLIVSYQSRASPNRLSDFHMFK